MSMAAVAVAASRDTERDDTSVVHVWSQRSRVSGDLAADVALLDSAERARAERFRFERDRRRYVQRHAFVRRVLGRYLELDPARVAIAIASHGKPVLDGSLDLSFNLSHADDVTVLAVADGRPVGVGLERVRAVDDASGLADWLFAPAEIASLRSAPPSSSSLAFLELWTRKEAVIKTMGAGLAVPLDGFTVLTRAGEAGARPRHAGGDLPLAFATIDAPSGYVGTVASAGARISVRTIDERNRPEPGPLARSVAGEA